MSASVSAAAVSPSSVLYCSWSSVSSRDGRTYGTLLGTLPCDLEQNPAGFRWASGVRVFRNFRFYLVRVSRLALACVDGSGASQQRRSLSSGGRRRCTAALSSWTDIARSSLRAYLRGFLSIPETTSLPSFSCQPLAVSLGSLQTMAPGNGRPQHFQQRRGEGNRPAAGVQKRNGAKEKVKKGKSSLKSMIRGWERLLAKVHSWQ